MPRSQSLSASRRIFGMRFSSRSHTSLTHAWKQTISRTRIFLMTRPGMLYSFSIHSNRRFYPTRSCLDFIECEGRVYSPMRLRIVPHRRILIPIDGPPGHIGRPTKRPSQHSRPTFARPSAPTCGGSISAHAASFEPNRGPRPQSGYP
jgi:hypothetical protein